MRLPLPVLCAAAAFGWSGPEVRVSQRDGASWLLIDGVEVSPQYFKATLTHGYMADDWIAHVKGHSGHPRNDRADWLANAGRLGRWLPAIVVD